MNFDDDLLPGLSIMYISCNIIPLKTKLLTAIIYELNNNKSYMENTINISVEYVTIYVRRNIDKIRKLITNQGLWGPKIWRLLHTISVCLHDNKVRFKYILEHVPYCLPCKICSKHLLTMLRVIKEIEYDFPVKLMMKIHNTVNVYTRKKKLNVNNVPYTQKIESFMYFKTLFERQSII